MVIMSMYDEFLHLKRGPWYTGFSKEDVYVNTATRLMIAISLTAVLGAIPSTGHANDDTSVDVFAFEVTGEEKQLQTFEAKLQTWPQLSKECEWERVGPDKSKAEKRNRLAVTCLRSQIALKELNDAFWEASKVEPAGEQALMMETTAATLSNCGGDCAKGCKCGRADGGVCSPKAYLGVIYCYHNLHGCIKR
jgi:hypothetical protein